MQSKTILITGSSSGIGRATAKYFAERGWNVIATMRHPEREEEFTKHESMLVTRLDVTDTASIETALKEGIERFGRIDAVLNNAGFGTTGPFETATYEQVEKQFAVNVFGVMNVTRAVLPLFRAQKSGVVATIASMGGRITFPLYSLYHSSKWAVEGFIESVHYELKPFGIRCKIIEPGVIKTNFYGKDLVVTKASANNPYGDQMDAATKRMIDSGATGSDPRVVAHTVYQAVTDGSGRLRYLTGKNAKLFLFLRWLLPARWFFGLTNSAVMKK